jgi:hypothetical protein
MVGALVRRAVAEAPTEDHTATASGS